MSASTNPIKIFGLAVSPNVHSIVLVCKEIGIPYELVVVDITKGEQHKDEFLAKNPFAMIPAIDDDGFVLFETQAICKYLVLKYGPTSGLVPPTSQIQQYAKYEQALSIQSYATHMQVHDIAFEKKFKAVFGSTTDEDKVKSSIYQVEKALAGYEVLLNKQKYLAGDVVTLADLFHLPWGHVAHVEYGVKVFDSYPAVSRWWKDISSRPAWIETLKTAA